jgi:carbon-monoxide dehydrogenase large subunit
VFVRSTVAHGTLRGVDTAAAAEMPGVVAALTADDLDFPEQGAGAPGRAARPLLARASSLGSWVRRSRSSWLRRTRAVDATEAAVVDAESLPVVVDPVRAASDGAPLLFPGTKRTLSGPAPRRR